MDDDVAVLPDGLDKLDAWSDKAEVIQGQRYDFDGGPFFWQYRFSTAWASTIRWQRLALTVYLIASAM